MATTTNLLLMVSLLTWTLLTCEFVQICSQEKAEIKDRLPISHYREMYLESLKQRKQPKTIIATQHVSTTAQPSTTQIDVQSSNNLIKCGTVVPDKIQAIINGQKAPEKRYPWQAYIRGKYTACGGVLISSQWVLTAAHCINNTVYIILGTNDIDNLIPHGKVSVPLKEIIHKGYNSFDNDIALIKLTKKVQFNDYIRPACLPETGANFVNVDCFVSGWGLTNYQLKTRPQLLQEVKVNVIDNMSCFIPLYLFVLKMITQQHLCTAINDLPTGTCSGDSGGPLSCLVGSSYYVAGVVSLGEEGCKKQLVPDVYTRVSFYKDWIKKAMENN